MDAPSDFPAPLVKALPSISESSLRAFNVERGRAVLEFFGYGHKSEMMREYNMVTAKKVLGGQLPPKQTAEFTARFILQTFTLVKLALTEVYYLGYHVEPLYDMCQGVERLTSYVGKWHQAFFGLNSAIPEATRILVSAILPSELYSEVDRTYIQVTPQVYWNIPEAVMTKREDLPPTTRVFAKMFDTEAPDSNIYIIPPFDEGQTDVMMDAYNELKDTPYNKWPDNYHWQCFKDWTRNNADAEFGMFSVLALPYMRPKLIRGSIFNVGTGHNGKSILLGLAMSILGTRNTSIVSGNDLGSWDRLVDLQTTWFNCPSETDLTFLKEQTAAFKTISAHETYAIRKKFGDVSVPITGNFPMAFNINDIPDFGEDALAILSRMFINNFPVDFEEEGRADVNYMEKTFFSDRFTIPRLVGMIFAFAHYYSQPEHEWKPSSTMTAERDAIKETATPQHRYIKWFKKFFYGYEGVRQLKDDYLSFGANEGESYDGSVIKTKSLTLKPFERKTDGNSTKYVLRRYKEYPVLRFVFSDKIYIRKYMGHMKYKEYKENGGSLVYAMMLDYTARYEAEKKRLKLHVETKPEGEIEKMVLQQMWKEIDEEQERRPYEWE